MITENVKIVNSLGLHARPAAQLVRITSRYNCDVFFTKDGNEINAKSIMGVMMLAAEQHSYLTIRCEGEGENECMNELKELIANKFNEE